MNRLFDNKNKNILIVTPDHINYDSIAASKVLGEMLESLGKKVTLLTNISRYKKQYEKDFSSDKLQVTGKVEGQDFVAKLPANREISNIEVKKDEDNFQIILNTKSGSLVEDTLSFVKGEVKYDLIALIGFTQNENSEEFIKSFKKNLTGRETILIHYTESPIKTNSKLIANVSSLSELVKVLSINQKIRLSKEQATQLLTGIFYNTNNLKINTNNQTISVVNELVNKEEADIFSANKILNEKMSKTHVTWQNLVFKNLSIHENICYSYIDDENITSEFIGSLNKEEKVPIARMKNCNTALVMVKLEDNIHGFLQTSSNKSALQITEGFYQLGDSNSVYFWSESEPEDILAKIFENIKLPTIEKKTEKEFEDTLEIEIQENEIEEEEVPLIDKDPEIPEESSEAISYMPSPIVEINSEKELSDREGVHPPKFEIKGKKNERNDQLNNVVTNETPKEKEPKNQTDNVAQTNNSKQEDFNNFVPPTQQQIWNGGGQNQINDQPKKLNITPEKLAEIKKRMENMTPEQKMLLQKQIRQKKLQQMQMQQQAQQVASPPPTTPVGRSMEAPTFVPPGYNPLPPAPSEAFV